MTATRVTMHACTTCDATATALDPTGTAHVRAAWWQFVEIRLQQLRAALRVAVIDNDALGLGGSDKPAHPFMSSGDRLEIFGRWLDDLLPNALPVSTCAPYVAACWNHGANVATAELGLPGIGVPPPARDLMLLIKTDVDGVMAALRSAVMRAVSELMTRGAGVRHAAFRVIESEIGKVAGVRLRATVNTYAVKTCNLAKISVYERGGVEFVGVEPEHLMAVRVGDAKAKMEKTKSRRLKKAPVGVAPATKNTRLRGGKSALVAVRTAEDDDVCPVCEEFAADGPYTLKKAAAALPLHPHCRCTVRPWRGRKTD